VLQAAIEGIDRADAQRLVQARAGRHFSNLNEVRDRLGPKAVVSDSLHSVASAFFEARGQLRLGEIVVGQRSLLYRQGVNVRTLWSERGAFPLVEDAAGAADTVSP
jgi:General secretion pathway protein K.